MCAIAAILALPGCGKQTEDKVHESTARATSSNNLKMIAIAMHSYADSQGLLPPQDGVMIGAPANSPPLLSWRVHILPYMEQLALYKQFKLDEPWDSEHNKKLIPQMPKTYMSARAPAETEKTYYKVFVGGGALFSHPNLYHIGNIPDGSSNTIMLIECGDPVIWTKPEDIEYDPKKPLPNLKLAGDSKILVGMADGYVRIIDITQISEKTMRNAIGANNSEPLGSDWPNN
jgi:Protein of unknown function (DUF1559)